MYLNSDPEKKLQVRQWLISATLPEFNHLQGQRGMRAPVGVMPGHSRPGLWPVSPGLRRGLIVVRIPSSQQHAALAKRPV
jgi:hypothetical protein